MKDSLFENLLTVEELAESLRVAPQTIRNWVAARSIPFVRVGRKSMFLRESIVRWLQEKEQTP